MAATSTIAKSESDIVLDDEKGAHLLHVDAEKRGSFGGLKMAKDGITPLSPQPSDDPNDPLNWSPFKKHAILIVLGISAFCGDFQSGAGIPALVFQAIEWGMDPNKVNQANNLNVLFLALGGFIWIPLLYCWGRLPVLFWTNLIGTATMLGTTLCNDFDTYYALRPINALFLTTAQVVGLTFINDLFFFHERTRKIGIWVSIFFLSPYASPWLGGFILFETGNWRHIFWLTFAICALTVVLIAVLCDETCYDRTIPQSEQPARGGLKYRIGVLTGWWQLQHKREMTAKPAFLRLPIAWARPVIFIIFVVYGISFMWAVGINITTTILFQIPEVAGGYGFNLRTISYIYFTPIVAVILGEFFGHFFNDWIADQYAKRHGGKIVPEIRLAPYYLSAPSMIAGLVLVGQALQRHLTVAAIVLGWGMYVFGVMIATVGVTAYLLDAYPTASGEMAALANFARLICGFTVGYFQLDWGMSAGFGTSFGIQAGLVGAATLLLTVVVLFGHKLRLIGPAIPF